MSGGARAVPGVGRVVLVGVGTVVAGYGVYLLLTGQDPAALLAAAWWLVGGVLLHDGLLVPLTLLLVAVASRLLPAAARVPALVCLVVLGPLTLLAVPVLGEFGARPDNPTLLDRPYLAGWGLIVATAAALAVTATLVRARRRRGGASDRPHQPDPEGG